MLVLCRELFGEVGLVSVLFRRGMNSVGMCSARSGMCGDVFGEVDLVSRSVRRGRVMVGMCSVR